METLVYNFKEINNTSIAQCCGWCEKAFKDGDITLRDGNILYCSEECMKDDTQFLK